MSTILGIDPGNTLSAWCKLGDRKPLASAKVPNEALLDMLRTSMSNDFEIIAIEMIASYGMAVGKEVFDTCLWIGRFIEAWSARGGKHKLVYRKDVKLFLCETTRANDANIRAALIDRFGPGREKAIGVKRAPGPLYSIKGDEWSALAVALTAEASVRHTPLFAGLDTGSLVGVATHPSGQPF